MIYMYSIYFTRKGIQDEGPASWSDSETCCKCLQMCFAVQTVSFVDPCNANQHVKLVEK